MSEVIFLSNVRLSFPHLAEPQRTENKVTGTVRTAFNADFLMPEGDPGFQQFMQQYKNLMVQTFGDNAAVVMNMILADRKLRCFGRGEEKVNKKTFKPYDGYTGNVYLSASSERPPQMIQSDGKPVDPVNTMAFQALARKMYGGCRVNVAVKPWVQKNQHGNGIRCDLVAVQFAGDDTPFGDGAPDVSGLFGAVAQTSAAAGMFGASAAPADLPSFFK
jgi:hypothetical protein